jgi:aminomethyltransferase
MTIADPVIAGVVRDYGDPRGEAIACRSSAALFDFSFMRRARISGPRALALVELLSARRVSDLAPGRIRYALRVDATGHVLADLTIWRIAATVFEVFSGRSAEVEMLRAPASDGAAVEDLGGETAILAVHGPASLESLGGIAPTARLRDLAYFDHAEIEIAGVPCRVGRLGYTGERGFEIIAPRAAGADIWSALARSVRPARFAAADILRIEAGFVLFTNELRFAVTPRELGLARFGDALPDALPPRVRLICFEAAAWSGSAPHTPVAKTEFPPRPGALLVTSVCRSPLAGGMLGLGFAAPGGTLLVGQSRPLSDIREVGLPFFDPGKRRPRGGWSQDLRPVAETGR